jgi:TP901 family phage tail tape measure protein
MTNIGLVTGQTTKELSGMTTEFNSMAKSLGTTTLEVASGATEWIRQGRSASDTMILLKNSTMLSKLGNIEAADATSKLTATVNAYNISAEDSIEIVDTLVALDNTLAASTQGIADGMQKASSMAKQAGVSYQNLASYIGVVISNTQQSGDTIGQAFSR